MRYHLSPYQVKNFEKFFSFVKVGNLIYPGNLKAKIAVDIITVYKMLEELEDQGFLSTVYEVYCHNCNKSKGVFLNSISEFDNDLHCDFCEQHLNAIDNLIVLYKVVSE